MYCGSGMQKGLNEAWEANSIDGGFVFGLVTVRCLRRSNGPFFRCVLFNMSRSPSSTCAS